MEVRERGGKGERRLGEGGRDVFWIDCRWGRGRRREGRRWEGLVSDANWIDGQRERRGRRRRRGKRARRLGEGCLLG